MEEIEQQIKLLTTQIKTVSSQIETVDLILEIDFDDWSQQQKRKYGNEEVEARKQLRSEKEQLRSEKEQLRRKEEQLLEQKTILMKKEAEGMIMKES
jgi:hypothetical protein